LVPVTAAAVIGAGGALGPMVADASPDLPDITPEQLLTRVQTAKVDALSGTVRTSSDLGLPAIPGGLGPQAQGLSELTDLLSGEHTVRVAFAEPDKARVSVLDTMAERVFVSDGKTAWAYDSSSREATRFTVPEHEKKARPEPRATNPQALARMFLDSIDPTTRVTVTGTKSVAGRDAYLLTLTPRTDRTLVGSVTLAVDAREYVPLRVSVHSRGQQEPAAEVGFTDVSFDRPKDSTFSFSPPKGTEVTEHKAEAKPERARPERKAPEAKPDRRGGPVVIGKGWDAVAVSRWQRDADGVLNQFLANAQSVSGSWGSGKLISTRMVTALFTDDGRVLVGMVPGSVLEQTAGTPAARAVR
jgi:outer membrane lipoprotein-sorting protein